MQRGKLLAGVAEPATGRLIELNKAKRFRILQQDAVGRFADNRAVDFFLAPAGLPPSVLRHIMSFDNFNEYRSARHADRGRVWL